MDWTENEDGPECICESPTVVKLMPTEPHAILLCLFHTPEAGTYYWLPEERPDDWPWTIERVKEYSDEKLKPSPPTEQ